MEELQEPSLSSIQRKRCVHGNVQLMKMGKSGVGEDTCNSGTWEAEARRATGMGLAR